MAASTLPRSKRTEREDFDPAKLTGQKRAHFDRQLARLRRTNDQGGVAFWTDNADLVVAVLRVVLDGGRVEEHGEGGLHIIPRGTDGRDF